MLQPYFNFFDSDHFYYVVISYLRLVASIQICTEVEKFRHVILDLDPLYPEGVSVYFLCDLKCSKKV
jgi:hypothetical protein